jgi:8-oxo-dGTP pyrophosphatase MutT (NUDIX family)
MPIAYKWKNFLIEGELRTVGIVVCLNDEQQFLIIRRSDVDERAGQWTIPGGHIEENDGSIERGAIRELREEANLSCHVDDLKYLGRPSPNKYYFLTQKWSGEVNVDKPNPQTGQVEHDDYKWATLEEIKDIANTKIPIYLLEKALEILKNEVNS